MIRAVAHRPTDAAIQPAERVHVCCFPVTLVWLRGVKKEGAGQRCATMLRCLLVIEVVHCGRGGEQCRLSLQLSSGPVKQEGPPCQGKNQGTGDPTGQSAIRDIPAVTRSDPSSQASFRRQGRRPASEFLISSIDITGITAIVPAVATPCARSHSTQFLPFCPCLLPFNSRSLHNRRHVFLRAVHRLDQGRCRRPKGRRQHPREAHRPRSLLQIRPCRCRLLFHHTRCSDSCRCVRHPCPAPRYT